MVPSLERNSFKNVSKGSAFLWQMQIQTIEYGLNDENTDKTRLKVNPVQDREPTHFQFYRILYKFLVFSSLFQRQ